MREEIQSCTQGVERVCQEVETLEGELAVRNVKMVDEEVEARLLCLRETILEQQNQQLLAANQTMASELVTLHNISLQLIIFSLFSTASRKVEIGI